MDFPFWDDMEIVRELLDMTMDELADAIGVSRMTINRWKKDTDSINPSHLAAFYSMAFRKGIRLNNKENNYSGKITRMIHTQSYFMGRRLI